MSTYIYDYNNVLNPTQDQKDAIIDLITNNYKDWDDDASARRAQWDKIEKTLYVDITGNDRADSENILLPEVYEQHQTLLANMIKSNFQNEDMSFNVQGEDANSEQTATLQKANLKDAMRKMGFLKVAHETVHHFLTKGEGVGFTHWETKIEQTRKKMTVPEDIIHPVTGELMGQMPIEKLQIVPKIVYDGVKVTPINPLHFVYDKNEVKSWDTCGKIIYSLMHPYDIVSNKDFDLLSKDDKAILMEMASNMEDLTSDKDDAKSNMSQVGQQAVVLEYWGDIKLSDGTVMKNYVATVVANRFLVRLEPNPYIINPISMAQWMPDPVSTRGRSPLLVAVPLNQVSSIILNGQLLALRLALNPPMLAPAGFFTDNYIKLKPGKIVEYDDYLNGARQPTPYTFENIPLGNDFLRLMETKMESSTGAFKYMTGAQDSRSRTATETSATVTGQNTRLSMMITLFNEEWTLPTIKNIAALQANTEFETTEVNMGKSQGQNQFGQVTPEVRQGNYRYTYGDSQSVVENEAKTQKLMTLLAPFAGKANINWDSLLQFILRGMNMENADEITQPDPIDAALSQMIGKQLPPETLQQLKEQFIQSGMLQQVVMQMMGGQNGQGTGQAGNGMAEQNVGAPQQSSIPGAEGEIPGANSQPPPQM